MFDRSFWRTGIKASASHDRSVVQLFENNNDQAKRRPHSWSRRSLNHLGHFVDLVYLVLVSFQLMYIFKGTVTMFWGKRLFPLLMYKRQFIPVTGDVPIEIVITFFRFIKHYLFCCLHLCCNQRSPDQRVGPALLIRCCVFLCVLFISFMIVVTVCYLAVYACCYSTLFSSLCLLLQCYFLAYACCYSV
jgi:hypothetical protein